MKKYRILDEGETKQPGDEYRAGDVWLPTKGNERVLPDFIRRPVPFEGKTAFLVTFAPRLRVVVDTTGLSEEELDNAVAEAAKVKFMQELDWKMSEFHDNIDWEETGEDTEVPYDPHADLFPAGCVPDGCNPENEFGKGDWWDAYQVGFSNNLKLQVQRIDEPTDSDPLASDEVAYELARLAGMEVDENGFVL